MSTYTFIPTNLRIIFWYVFVAGELGNFPWSSWVDQQLHHGLRWAVGERNRAGALAFRGQRTRCRSSNFGLVVLTGLWYVVIWYDVIWYDVIWYDMKGYDMKGYDMMWYDMKWKDMIWKDMIWCDMMWYDMMWYDMMWYDMMWYDMIWLRMKSMNYHLKHHMQQLFCWNRRVPFDPYP